MQRKHLHNEVYINFLKYQNRRQRYGNRFIFKLIYNWNLNFYLISNPVLPLFPVLPQLSLCPFLCDPSLLTPQHNPCSQPIWPHEVCISSQKPSHELTWEHKIRAADGCKSTAHGISFSQEKWNQLPRCTAALYSSRGSNICNCIFQSMTQYK